MGGARLSYIDMGLLWGSGFCYPGVGVFFVIVFCGGVALGSHGNNHLCLFESVSFHLGWGRWFHWLSPPVKGALANATMRRARSVQTNKIEFLEHVNSSSQDSWFGGVMDNSNNTCVGVLEKLNLGA